jgi:hypothetical protein
MQRLQAAVVVPLNKNGTHFLLVVDGKRVFGLFAAATLIASLIDREQHQLQILCIHTTTHALLENVAPHMQPVTFTVTTDHWSLPGRCFAA